MLLRLHLLPLHLLVRGFDQADDGLLVRVYEVVLVKVDIILYYLNITVVLYRNVMCFIRVQTCEECPMRINEFIVTCPEIDRIAKVNHPLAKNVRILEYSRTNMQTIMDMHEHQVDTVYRKSSLCSRCYMIRNPSAGVHVYTYYRQCADSWTKTKT